MSEDADAYLKNIARDMQALRSMLTEVVLYMKDAESEVPEKMRRFMMYMHDMHDIKYMYEELGLEVPAYIMREVERCDDRLKHLLKDLFDLDKDGKFERVRQDMTQRGGNRYDHTRLIGGIHETGNGQQPKRPAEG